MAKVTFDKDGLAKTSGILTVYSFDSVTGEYAGTSEEYLMPGVGLPANACTLTPPDVESGSVAVYRNGNWATVADHRGETVFSILNAEAVTVEETGDYPASTTPLKPSTDFDLWDGKQWVTDVAAESAALVREAGQHRDGLIAEANEVTQAWQTQLLLGIINDSDKARLTAWMKYVQDVQAVDTSATPEISWPKKPE